MIMEKLLELDDITLYPCDMNLGFKPNKKEYLYVKNIDGTGSFPIFTAPIPSIVGSNSAKIWSDNGIRPIIPLTEPIQMRLNLCCYVFSAFSLAEVTRYFINEDRRLNQRVQYHICLDCGNGHDNNLFDLGANLKKLYGNQVILMGGNVANPLTYSHFARKGFDYMRLGINSGSLVKKSISGFHYPMASLLIDTRNHRDNVAKAYKPVKIIADGGISCYSDILKALALGADYVMIGKEFIKISEAEGPILQEIINPDTHEKEYIEIKDIDKSQISSLNAKINGYCRPYKGNMLKDTKKDPKWRYIDIECNLSEWIMGFFNNASFAFMLAGARSWEEYKKNIRYGRIK